MRRIRFVSILLTLLCIVGRIFSQNEPHENYPYLIPKLDRSTQWLGVALHLDMFLAYDSLTCQLVTAWAPDINPPAMVGYPYLDKEVSLSQWKIYRNGVPESAGMTKWIGAQVIFPDAVLLTYQVQPVNGDLFTVKELVSVITEKMPSRPGLVRNFEVSGGGEGLVLALPVRVNSLLSGGDLKTTGKFLVSKKIKKMFEWGDLYDFRGDLELTTDKPTSLAIFFPIDPEQIVKSAGAVNPTTGKPVKEEKKKVEEAAQEGKKKKKEDQAGS